MTDYPGGSFPGGFDFTNPDARPNQSTWQVLDWSDAVVSINKYPLSKVQSIETIRDLNIGAGTCSIRLSDPDKIQYNLFQAGDEIEIYFSTQTDPPIGRKIWGGFVDNLSFDINDGQTLKLSGKEYISRLQSQTYSGSFSTTVVSDAIKTIMATQIDFSYEGVEAVAYQTTMDIKKDSIYNALKQICDQFHIYFWINPENRDMETREAATISYAPDLINEGVNLLRSASVKKNSEYLINDVTVNYAGSSTPATATNATSQSQYGTYSRSVAIGNINDSTSATNFGTTLVTNRGAPIDAYEIESLFLPYTDPGEYLTIIAPTIELNGAYQVLQVRHSWSKDRGIRSTVQLNTQLVTNALYMADLERRLRLAEKYAFGSTQAP